MIIYASVVSMHVYIIMSLHVFIYSLPSQVQQLLPSRIKVCQIMSIITKVQGGVKEGALKKLHVEPQDNSNDEWSSESWYVLLFLSFSCSSGFTTEFSYFHVLWSHPTSQCTPRFHRSGWDRMMVYDVLGQIHANSMGSCVCV